MNRRTFVSVVGLLCFGLSGSVEAQQQTGIKDTAAMSPQVAEAVKRLSEARILEGYPDSTFRPDQPMKRNEVTVALFRFMTNNAAYSAKAKKGTLTTLLAVFSPLHSYGMQEEEATANTNEPDKAVRSDFFNGKHKYSRDADGLYTPPPYLFDELSSAYGDYLTRPFPVTDDQLTQDGTVKHFMRGWINANQTPGERVCEWIEDRYGNRTKLRYEPKTYNGVTRQYLKEVEDPSGRILTFHWSDLDAGSGTQWRIVQVDSPMYSVVYQYETTGVNAYNLKAVIVDATQAQSPIGAVVAGSGTHEARKTSFLYNPVSVSGETGLLTSIVDPLGHDPTTGDVDPALGHRVDYAYAVSSATNTVWVNKITEVVPPDASTPNTLRYFCLNIYPGVRSTSVRSAPEPNFTDILGFHLICDMDLALRNTYTRLYIGSIQYNWGEPEYVLPDNQGTPNFYTTTYNTQNQVTRTWAQQSALPRVDNYHYNEQGNPDKHWVEGYASIGEVTTYYNSSKYFQKQSVIDSKGRTTMFYVGDKSGYDEYSDESADGNKGSVMAVEGPAPDYLTYTYKYNDAGQKTAEVNPKGNITTFHYGGLGATGGYPAISDDDDGNLTQVVQDTEINEPAANAINPRTNAPYLKRRTRMQYDAAGRVTASYDPKAQASTFFYNNLGQPEYAVFPATANTPDETISYDYAPNGRMISVSETCPSNGTLSRGTTTLTYYDGVDAVKTVDDPTSGTVEYAYGKYGERRKMTLPGGGSWTYFFGDHLGGGQGVTDVIMPKDDPNSIAPRLTAMRDDGNGSNGTVREVQMHVSRSGQLRQFRFNRTFDSSQRLVQVAVTNHSYDTYSTGGMNYTHGWLKQTVTNLYHATYPMGQVSWSAATGISSNPYDYNNDETGLRAKNSVLLRTPQNGVIERNETYFYDHLNRLKDVYYNNDGSGQHQNYTFDETGNRVGKADNVTGSETYSSDAANRLFQRVKGGTTYSYINDLNGNTETGDGRTNTWDSQNRLVRCVKGGTTSNFLYGADGNRRQTSVTTGGTTTIRKNVLDNGMMVQELQGSGANAGNPVATYFQGAGGPAYKRTGTPIPMVLRCRGTFMTAWAVW